MRAPFILDSQMYSIVCNREKIRNNPRVHGQVHGWENIKNHADIKGDLYKST